MRRMICIGLALACALLPWFSCAQGAMEISPTYSGAYVPMESHGFMVYLPNEWLAGWTEDGTAFTAGNDAWTQSFLFTYYDNDAGYTPDALYLEFAQSVGYANVSPMIVNGTPYVYYESISEDAFGWVTLSDDGASLLFFKFMRCSDDGMKSLGIEMMASIRPMDP